MTFVDPERAQFEAFKDLPRDQPIEMLNLVRLRDVAVYPEDHALADKSLTGAQAYASYSHGSGPVFQRLEGKIVWRGTFQITLIGPSDEAWDLMFIARDPEANRFFAMVTDPEYQKAVVHRQAAVTTSRLIRCAPAETGALFG
ncbi:DUF1330 domain-containing protein [Thalassococcus sp. S3]|uniref:DUF1330 domain-containing protein n=1 Tax=Thalassococcus sp. S3 TaxID=2017482 RepID=UPI0010248BC7|nr:DUF1330 domain-containing protein [Thalassococcus sp. S3]QBF31066.1 DUF1330 domain-containing protein [Thalassococcus sp. S3]